MYTIEKAADYDELSKVFSDMLIELVIRKPDASIIVATGSSPLLGYRLFVRRVKEENINISRITFIKLDEWVGLSSACKATCEFFIRQELLNPLHVDESHYISFRCEANNPEEECDRIQSKLEKLKSIDLAVLGVGKNGHLGLNEPGDFLSMWPHVVSLDDKTKSHAMLTKTEQEVNKGMTLGFGNFFEAKKVVLLMCGLEKEDALREFYKDYISTKLPISLIKLHRNLLCIVEERLSQ